MGLMVCAKSCNQLISNNFCLRKHLFKFLLLSIGYIAFGNCCSKNKRVVTVIDTEVKGGSRIGLVAMIEIVALMIGGISLCYSEYRYDDPVPVKPHMRLVKGQPKSLYLPGSSVDVLLSQKNRITFDADIVSNLHRHEVQSRFLRGFQKLLVETEVSVRSSVARQKN